MGDRNVQISHVSRAQITIRIGDGPTRSIGLRPGLWVGDEDPFGASSLAALLHAAAAVVPYDDATGVLAGLAGWAQTDSRAAMAIVAGAAGTGKTRLAGQLCAGLEASDHQWLAGVLRRDFTPGEIEALAATPTARLIVIDYAEARPTTAADVVTRLAESATEEAPLRIVLLTRATSRGSTDPKALLYGSAGRFNAAVESATTYELSAPVWRDPQTRTRLFETAAAAIAERRDVEVPSLPEALSAAAYDRPLTIIAAAGLACVDDRDVPRERKALLDRLVTVEAEHWRRTAARASVEMSDETRRHVAAFATLAGSDREADAATLLGRLERYSDVDTERRFDIAGWIAGAYQGQRYWNPVEPDMVGEHLVATALRQHPEMISAAIRDRDAVAVQRPIELLARAAQNYPGDTTDWARSIGEHFANLITAAIDQADTRTVEEIFEPSSADSLALLVDQLDLDPQLLRDAAGQLQRPNIALNRLQTAILLRFSDACRQLADANPASHLPILAAAVHDLANHLAQAGRRDEALAAAEEAADLFRQLANANPAAYLPDLAGSINNLAARLSGAGRRDEALIAIEEAVGISRQLTHVHQPQLAGYIANLATFMSQAGRHREAVSAAGEAVDQFRQLADANPAAYLPDLAKSVDVHATCLHKVGRHDEALTAAEEAVDLYRTLADAKPAAYLPDLAGSINNLAIHRGQAGRHRDALVAVEEAVAIKRRLAEANPAAYLPDLATSIHNSAKRLGKVGRHNEALAAAEEAVDLYRTLADANLAAYLPDLAASVTSLAVDLGAVGRRGEALTAAEEAVDLYRQLANANPAAYLPGLAGSMHNLGTVLAMVGRGDEAVVAAREAVAINRQLADRSYAANMPGLAMSVIGLAVHLSVAGRRDDALTAAEEAVDLYRQLANANPAAHLPNLAMSVNILANQLAEAGREDDAAAARQECAAIGAHLGDRT